MERYYKIRTCKFVSIIWIFCVTLSQGHLTEEWKKYTDTQVHLLRSELMQYVKDHALIMKTLATLNWHLLTLKMDVKQVVMGRRIMKTKIHSSMLNITQKIQDISEKVNIIEEIIGSQYRLTTQPSPEFLLSSSIEVKGRKTTQMSTERPTTKTTTEKPTTKTTQKSTSTTKSTTAMPTTTSTSTTTTTIKPTTTPRTTTTTTPTTTEQLRIRLANGRNQKEGRVEVYYSGQWGTVCADNFDATEANVICRMLGYSRGSIRVYRDSFGPGSGPIWLDDLRCRGNENSLFDCGSNGWGIHNCAHMEDAGVQCH